MYLNLYRKIDICGTIETDPEPEYSYYFDFMTETSTSYTLLTKGQKPVVVMKWFGNYEYRFEKSSVEMTPSQYLSALHSVAHRMESSYDYPEEQKSYIAEWNHLVDLRFAFCVSMEDIVKIRNQHGRR